MTASVTLLDALWVPGQVIIYYQRTELEIDAFGSRLGGDHDAPLFAEVVHECRAYVRGARAGHVIRALIPLEPGARQIVVLDVESVQTSRGYAVPLYEFREDRPLLSNCAARKGEDGIRAYWAEKNTASIDGLPTGMREVLDTAE